MCVSINVVCGGGVVVCGGGVVGCVVGVFVAPSVTSDTQTCVHCFALHRMGEGLDRKKDRMTIAIACERFLGYLVAPILTIVMC